MTRCVKVDGLLPGALSQAVVQCFALRPRNAKGWLRLLLRAAARSARFRGMLAGLEEEAAAQQIDRALVLRVAAGDVEALASLYDRHVAGLLGVALRILRDRARAEDTIHDLFVALHERAARYDVARGAVATWLMTMTRNLAIDRARTRARQNRLSHAVDAYAPTPAPDPAASADGHVVRGALASLPEDQRSILVAVYFDGLTYTEIAEGLSLPLGTVKSRAARGLEALREKLSGDESRLRTYHEVPRRGAS